MSGGQVTTFYSYKGGVGRTFLMANVAWLLARWGRRVLCLDWDLEAPGLRHYLTPAAPPRPGVLDLIHGFGAREPADWRNLAATVDGSWTGRGSLSLIGAGRQGDRYVKALAGLNWAKLFKTGLAPYLEELRAQWIADYDHVLLDSRTGVSDVGGICAAQLPDLLVMALTTSQQSIEGTLDVAKRARVARDAAPVDRGGFRCLPVLTRMHIGEETPLEREWMARFEERLAPLLIWRDAEVEVRSYLSALRVPEYARWSYGEPLPVITERTDDPGMVSWVFANVAAMVDQGLRNSGQLYRERNAYVRTSAGDVGMGAPDVATRPSGVDVFISYPSVLWNQATQFYEALRAHGLKPYMDDRDMPAKTWFAEELYRVRESIPFMAVLLASGLPQEPVFRDELLHILRLAAENRTTVIPIFLDDEALSEAPLELKTRLGFLRPEEHSWDAIALRLARFIRPRL